MVIQTEISKDLMTVTDSRIPTLREKVKVRSMGLTTVKGKPIRWWMVILTEKWKDLTTAMGWLIPKLTDSRLAMLRETAKDSEMWIHWWTDWLKEKRSERC